MNTSLGIRVESICNDKRALALLMCKAGVFIKSIIMKRYSKEPITFNINRLIPLFIIIVFVLILSYVMYYDEYEAYYLF